MPSNINNSDAMGFGISDSKYSMTVMIHQSHVLADMDDSINCSGLLRNYEEFLGSTKGSFHFISFYNIYTG